MRCADCYFSPYPCGYNDNGEWEDDEGDEFDDYYDDGIDSEEAVTAPSQSAIPQLPKESVKNKLEYLKQGQKMSCIWGWSGCNCLGETKKALTQPVVGNSAPKTVFHEGADNMAQIQLGKTFSTGNSVVAQLPVDALLRVSAQGQLEVVELPEAEETHNPGDRFDSKYGPATVVKMTSRFADVGRVVSGAREGFLYVADGTDTVRVVLA